MNLHLSHAPAPGHDDVEVLTIGGDVDICTQGALRDCLHGMTRAGRARIVLNLGPCSFLESTGIGVIVGAVKACRAAGGDAVIAAPSSRIVKTLQTLGLTRVWGIADSVPEAVRLLGEPYPFYTAPLPPQQDALFPVPPAAHPELEGDIAEYLTDRLYSQVGEVMILAGGRHRVLYAEERAELGLAAPGEDEDGDGRVVLRREDDGALFEVAVSVFLTRVAVPERAAQ